MRYEQIYEWIYLVILIILIAWTAYLIHKRKKEERTRELRHAEREAGRYGRIEKER